MKTYVFMEEAEADYTKEFLPEEMNPDDVFLFNAGDVISVVDNVLYWVHVKPFDIYVAGAWIDACIKDGTLELLVLGDGR